MPSKSAVEVDDARIEFLLEGAGDAVVLIPGGGLDASYFDGLDRATPRNDWVEPPSQAIFLVVQGLKDRVAPPEHGRAFRKQRGSRVQVVDIPDAGHMVFLEQPEAVADAVVSFLRQQAA